MTRSEWAGSRQVADASWKSSRTFTMAHATVGGRSDGDWIRLLP